MLLLGEPAWTFNVELRLDGRRATNMTSARLSASEKIVQLSCTILACIMLLQLYSFVATCLKEAALFIHCKASAE